MSYNPVIASARRAAKQHARDTGSPYQASLDLVARRAGLEDWDAYLANPAEIPVSDGRDLYVDGPEHAHNMRSIMIATIGTMPALLALPFAISRGRPVIGPDLHVSWQTVQNLGLSAMLWLLGGMMAVMFFGALAVHPDVPDPGRDGKRDRHTSKDLATTSLTISAVAAVLMLIGPVQGSAYLAQTWMLLGAGAVAGAVALLVRHHLARRILALVSMNGTTAAFLLLIGALQG